MPTSKKASGTVTSTSSVAPEKPAGKDLKSAAIGTRWMESLTYVDGRWRGAVNFDARRLDVHSTWYGKEKFRKGAKPPTRVENQLSQRTQAVLEQLRKLTELASGPLATLWNTEWHEQRERISAKTMMSALAPSLILFNAGERADEHMVTFAPPPIFGGYEPQLTVRRGALSALSVTAPLDPKTHKTTLPFLGAQKHYVALRALTPSPTKVDAKPVKKPKPLPTETKVELAWAGALRFDEKHLEWRGTATMAGQKVAIALRAKRDDVATRAKAVTALTRLSTVMPSILEDVARRAAELYESSWSDATKPPIDRSAVLRKTKLKAVEMDGSRFVLRLSDGGLFGKHVIEALGDKLRLQRIDLVG